MARARQRSWRWPWERLRPPEAMGESRDVKGLVLVSAAVADVSDVIVDSSRDEGAETRWTRWRASLSSASLDWSKISRLDRTVPASSNVNLSESIEMTTCRL